jgi:hypothetical protein
MSLNTIQDIERYSITVRLDKTAYAGNSIVYLRSTPQVMVGAELYFEPQTVRAETRTVSAVDEHAVTLTAPLTYRHEIDTPAIRLDLLSISGSSDVYALSEDAPATSTDVTVTYIPSWLQVGSYVFIDAYTVECEVRKITSIAGNVIAFTTALAYSHVAGDITFFQETDVINAKWFGAKGDGVLNSPSDLRCIEFAVIASQDTDSREVFIPAGTYIVPYVASGWYLYMLYDNMTLRGEGMGRTVLKMEDNFSWTGNVTLIRAYGKRNSISDLTITAGPGMKGDGNSFSVIALTEGSTTYCLFSEVKRVEICNIIAGTDSSGGTGIGTYNSWWYHEVDTTFASAVSAPGSVAVTPTSMEGIRNGQRLLIEWVDASTIDEEVVVTSVTKTTFTATFANTHAIGARIVAYSQSETHCLIEDCYVHDCYQFTAYGSGSNGNTWRRCRAIRGSGSVTSHGFYNTSGYNVYDSCWVEGWCGYSYHNYKSSPRRDTAGDMFANCVSINPGQQHMFHSGVLNDAAPYNTDYLTNGELLRYTTVRGCLFKNTNGYTVSCLSSNHPIIVEGCTFEDTYMSGGGGMIYLPYGDPSIVRGNYFRFENEPLGATNNSCIAGATVIEGNIIDNSGRTTGIPGIVASGNSVAKNNILYNSSIAVSGEAICEGNQVINTIAYGPFIVSTATGLIVRNNRFKMTGGGDMCNVSLVNVVGVFENNDFDGLKLRWATGINTDFIWRNNKGQIGTGYTSANLGYRSGDLRRLVAGATIEQRRLVKMSGTGVIQATTSDTVFVGVSAYYTASAEPALLIHQIGAVCELDCDDAWTEGNYGIQSVSDNGKIHDSGGSSPAFGVSCVVFLDTGGSAGVAKVMLLRTL